MPNCFSILGVAANNTGMGQPLIISQDAVVLSQVQSSAAAASIDVQVCDTPAEIRRAWAGASLVIVGVDRAATVAGLGLPARGGVHIVGADADTVLAWSVPLGAPGLVLPGQAGFLAALLDDAQLPGGSMGAVLRVFGATGGVGASTLAASLAVRAAKRGKRVGLVELCPYGGGIDIMMGAEQDPGWRWGDLAAARGHVGDLAAHLPTVLGVSIVAASRCSAEPAGPVGGVPERAARLGAGRGVGVATTEAISAVLASLRRTHDLVVIDQGRTPPTGEDTLLVVAAEVRSVLAAQAMVASGLVTARRVVVRTGVGRRLPTDLIADTLGAAVAGVVPNDGRLPIALEAGDPPGRARGRISRASDALLDRLMTDWRL